MPSPFIYDVSGTFEVPYEQYTHFFGNAPIAQKFIITIPIPTNCIVRNDDVFYNDYWIGKVNKTNISNVDICNMELVSCNIDEEGLSFEFRQVE